MQAHCYKCFVIHSYYVQLNAVLDANDKIGNY